MATRKKVRCITINTDASYSHQYKIGGYAFYIVCDLFKIQKAGIFKNDPKSSIKAEMMCIANAIHTLTAQKELPIADLIVINSDCLNSFSIMCKKSKCSIGRTVAIKIKHLRNALSNRGVMPKYEFRHVKAHNGTPDARSWVNDWCDKEAKKMMRKACVEKLDIEKI